MFIKNLPSWVLKILLVIIFPLGMIACKKINSEVSTSSTGDTTGKPVVDSTSFIKESTQQTITVYAAASLMDAFQEIGRRFEINHAGIKISCSFAGTQILRTQLEQGAYADVIATADRKNMENLEFGGIVDQNSIQVFARNHLLVVLPPGNPARVDTIMDLGQPGLKIVMADSSVPAGDYTRRVLFNLSTDDEYGAGFAASVLRNVVSNETDVRQVVTKVELGEADAGIVYASDAISAKELRTLEIPLEFNINAEYPIAIISSTHYPELAGEFIDFVLSPTGQAILSEWGFSPGK